MKKLACMLALMAFNFHLNAQCTSGYITAALNWDNLSFLTSTSTGFSGFVSSSMVTTQNFAFGKNRLTVSFTSGLTPAGTTTSHTGESNAIGSGADIEFDGLGTVTLTFKTEVANVKFTVADIDGKQTATFTATNAAAIALPVTLNKTSAASTDISITGSGTTTAVAKDTRTNGQGTGQGNTSNASSVNVDVTGPVKTINIAFSNNTGEFFISDVQACITEPVFPSAYRIVSKPYTNQPGYLLTAFDSSVYMVDPATGAAKLLFTDPARKNINSLAYDPHNKIVYYTYSLTTNKTTNKQIKKYDVNTETLSTLINDITTLGLPTFTSGVESGGASFYDGALYIGIEGESDGKSIIWRIDFDATLNAISATQVFSITTAGHDWGDFVASNGIIYDFDGAASGAENIYHIDLQNGTTTNTYSSLGFGIRQVAANWNDVVYNIGGAPASNGEVAPYNYNGTVNTLLQQTIHVGATTPSGSWGDADGGFIPKVDFGDAPASYDPISGDPAIHEIDSSLRLGSSIDKEWSKKGATATANADTDDALPFVPIFCKCTNSYNVTVNVWNNTGSNATLMSWLDYNNNGVFDAGEAVSATVPSMAQMQPITLNWTNAPTTIPANSYMYLRMRLTNGVITAANATGYMQNGEVEDYRVLVDTFLLPVHITSFTANKKASKSEIKWNVTSEKAGDVYELQRSADGLNWSAIFHKNASATAASSQYNFIDETPVMPVTHYRLKQVQKDGAYYYSKVEKIVFDNNFSVSISPNPATKNTTITINTAYNNDAAISILTLNGKQIFHQKIKLFKGVNFIPLHSIQTLNKGFYFVQISNEENKIVQKLIIQ